MTAFSQRIDSVKAASRDLPTSRVAVSCASSGNNTLVASASGYRIVVLAGCLVSASAVTVKFQSGAGGTDLTGAMSLITGTPLPLAHSPLAHLRTASGELLNLVLGGAVQVSGWLVYTLEPDPF